MGTVNPRPRGGASLSGELRASRDDRQQIRRLLSRPPVPKPIPAVPAPTPPPPPATAGPVGLARASCRSVDTDTTPGIATADSAPGSWRFYDPSGHGGYVTPGTSPGLAESTFGHFNVTQSGWYAMSLRGDYAWTGTPPPWIEVHLNPATTSTVGDNLQLTQVHPVFAGTAGYFHASLPAAWVPSPADDPGNTPGGGFEIGLLGFEIRYPSGTFNYLEVWMDIVRLA